MNPMLTTGWLFPEPTSLRQREEYAFDYLVKEFVEDMRRETERRRIHEARANQPVVLKEI